MLSATLLHMQPSDSSSESGPRCFIIENEEQARHLANPNSVAHLVPFWGRDTTIAQAARELDRPLNSVHYRVTKLHEAGLLAVTATTARTGRPIKHYRSRAERFFVPDHLKASEDTELLLAKIQPLIHKIARGHTAASLENTTGRCLYLDDSRRLHSYRSRLNPSGDTSTSQLEAEIQIATVQYGDIYLTPEAAKTLQAELKRVIDRHTRGFKESKDANQRQYSFIAAIAPTTEK